MKNLTLFGLFILLTLNSFKPTTPTNYTLDPQKSIVKWTGHAGAGAYAPTGTIKVKSGSITVNGTTITAGKIIIDMPTLQHDNKQLEEHLKGADFFDCEKCPESTFVLKSVTGNKVSGNLTIKNITHQITFPATIDKQNGSVVFKATIPVDRTLFNIKYNSASYFQDLGSYAIKNEFELDINIQFNLS